MPNKYPGGYQIVDLGGITITTTNQVVDFKDGLYYTIEHSNKPVYITNFKVAERYERDFFSPALPLVAHTPGGSFFFGVPTCDEGDDTPTLPVRICIDVDDNIRIEDI